MLVWNVISLASPEKQGGKSPNAPCCDKGTSVLAYQILDLLPPHCCKDGEVWRNYVSSFLLVENGDGIWGEKVVLMLSGGLGHGFFLAIGEHLGGRGKCFGLQ